MGQVRQAGQMGQAGQALAALAAAQNNLTRLLLAEPRDLPAIIEAGENVRRLEHQAAEAERRRPILRMPR